MNFAYTPTEVKNLIEQAGLRLTRKRGQNFLLDQNLRHYIVDQGNLRGDEFVLEVGTGLGSLTCLLAQRARHVLSYEIDAGLYRLAQPLLAPFPNIDLRHESILHQNHFPESLFSAIQQWGPPVIVSNFPYSIATIIVLELGHQKVPVQRIIGSFQKEVGEKLVAEASTEDYGVPSVLAQHYYQVEKLKVLPPQVFWPKPEIDSVVLRLLPNPTVSSFLYRKQLQSIVRGSFHLRRKTLENSLSHYFHRQNSELRPWIVKANLEGSRRGESLTLQEYLRLTEVFVQEAPPQFWAESPDTPES
ncbi:MAG: 16S rRNA (adenine(1518)-N(6)/adenine(1519)-N(6))-dimethyltransferase RsmA [Planctomycetota bacterium]